MASEKQGKRIREAMMLWKEMLDLREKSTTIRTSIWRQAQVHDIRTTFNPDRHAFPFALHVKKERGFDSSKVTKGTYVARISNLRTCTSRVK